MRQEWRQAAAGRFQIGERLVHHQPAAARGQLVRQPPQRGWRKAATIGIVRIADHDRLGIVHVIQGLDFRDRRAAAPPGRRMLGIGRPQHRDPAHGPKPRQQVDQDLRAWRRGDHRWVGNAVGAGRRCL